MEQLSSFLWFMYFVFAVTGGILWIYVHFKVGYGVWYGHFVSKLFICATIVALGNVVISTIRLINHKPATEEVRHDKEQERPEFQ